jgi:hypothetical protein
MIDIVVWVKISHDIQTTNYNILLQSQQLDTAQKATYNARLIIKPARTRTDYKTLPESATKLGRRAGGGVPQPRHDLRSAPRAAESGVDHQLR